MNYHALSSAGTPCFFFIEQELNQIIIAQNHLISDLLGIKVP